MKTQVNVRLTEEEVRALDALRMKIANTEGTIPTRSDVVRKAIANLIQEQGSGQNSENA